MARLGRVRRTQQRQVLGEISCGPEITLRERERERERERRVKRIGETNRGDERDM